MKQIGNHFDIFSQIMNREKKEELNLKNLNLTDLPLDLSKFKNLYKLDISQNPFTNVYINILIIV